MKNYSINKEAAKISTFSSGKFDQYEYLTRHAKLAYSWLGKALEKQKEKQVDAIKFLDFSNKISELDQLKSIFL